MARGSASNCSRRQFLYGLAATLPASLASSPLGAANHAGPAGLLDRSAISPHLTVHSGPIHVGIVHHQGRALIIDCGDATVQPVLNELRIDDVEELIFTHYHRDQLCGLREFGADAKHGVPEQERSYFERPQDYWNNDNLLYRVYRSFRPDHLLPVEPIQVDKVFRDGDWFSFGPAKISVLGTPGHTDGSVSYLVEVDGKRVVFCGDLLAGDGQIWDLYSLQRGFQRGEQTIGGYHGFMGDRWRLAESLQAVADLSPDLIVPSHGTVISNPAAAIRSLVERLETCYENYVSISALRFYFPMLFERYVDRPGQMPIREGSPPPACLRHIGTTWMIVSRTGAAWVMDVGSPGVVRQLQTMLEEQEITSIEGLWITHYHHDHTDGIVEFQRTFDCPCMTDQKLADVLTRPNAWRLPCLIPEPVQVHRPMQDGETWQWQEFQLTSYFYPGQTLYHAALLVEVDDKRMLFVGDSHTPGGLDDYCAYNRNLLGREVGFQYCLSLLERLKPTHLFNCHVDDAFTFTPIEIDRMRQQLDAREQLFGALTPWPHANFATDPSWVRVDPYLQHSSCGATVSAAVVVTNHALSAMDFRCRAVFPQVWGEQKSQWRRASVPSRQEALIQLTWQVPANVAAGRYVITIDVRTGSKSLPRFTECIVDIADGASRDG